MLPPNWKPGVSELEEVEEERVAEPELELGVLVVVKRVVGKVKEGTEDPKPTSLRKATLEVMPLRELQL